MPLSASAQFKNSASYEWTLHAQGKMRFYNLSPSRVLRVMHSPQRVEKGIARGTVAVMQPVSSSKNNYEIWVMYQEVKKNDRRKKRIITAWRYPGKSPVRDPIPFEVLQEIKEVL